MGVNWSKELGQVRPKDMDEVMQSCFNYLGGISELREVALVSRLWSQLLGDAVVPERLQELQLLAWYDADGIEVSKSQVIPTCPKWVPNPPQSASRLLDVFTFPTVCKLRAAVRYEAIFEDTNMENWDAMAAGPPPRVSHSKAGHRCLQFVDAAGRNPAYLQTMRFKQAIDQPVTIFCVGIAFDDATYLSGIETRFELCHGYSQTHRDDERAAVSMTAHPVEDSSDSDEPHLNSIVTGTTQPGNWHVYSAVFNGAYSELYVDGMREGSRSNVGAGMLDGLTVGTDHRNDFPLGSMVDGAIPGVIAELAVFGTVLDVEDRVRMEMQLMRRHGIDPPTDKRAEERRRERQAQAMLTERAPGTRHEPCPLRYLARNNLVSWEIEHPITGNKVRPKRIGVRETAESSDW